VALQIRRASPIGVVKVPRFAFQRREQCSGNNDSISCHYSWRYVAHSASPDFPELAYKVGSTDWKWNYGYKKMKAK
jgi:hypothetical protein